jgi:hypothetical protein
MTEELRGVPRLLDAFENGATMRIGGKDVTQREIEILKREIAHDEAMLAHSRGDSADA